MRKPFSLEQTYRGHFESHLFDLSSSAPSAPRLGDLFPEESDARDLLSCALGYGPGGGTVGLRQAVAGLYAGLSADNVLITAGALEAIRAAAMALVPETATVIVQSPSYGALEQAILDQGASAVPLYVGPNQTFDLSQLAHSSARVAFLNSPSGIDGSHVEGLSAFAGRLVVDEVYRPISLVPGMTKRSVVDWSDTAVAIGDLSKPLGLGGLRIGWIVSRDLDAIHACADALDYLSGSVSTVSARAAQAAMERFDELLSEHTARARRNLQRWTAFAEQHEDWLDWTPPQAGFSALVRLRMGDLPPASRERLHRAGVFLLPGAVFGYPNHLRIGFGGQEADFCRALELLGCELRLSLPALPVERRTGEVILLTKVARPGFGKSRIAAAIGIDPTARLASAFLQDTTSTCLQRSSRLFVAVDPPEDAGQLPWLPSAAEVFGQRGADLGSRINNAFAEAFRRGARYPILIGSDSPTLPSHLLSVAHRALERHDVVIGPAEDGGYYAIGLRSLQPRLFEDIDWSTSRVLEQTIQRCWEAQLSVFCLPYWYDVDTQADLARLRDEAQPGSATAVALDELSL